MEKKDYLDEGYMDPGQTIAQFPGDELKFSKNLKEDTERLLQRHEDLSSSCDNSGVKIWDENCEVFPY